MLVTGFPAGLGLSEEVLLDKLEIFFGKTSNGGGDVESRKLLPGGAVLGFTKNAGKGPTDEIGADASGHGGEEPWMQRSIPFRPRSGPAPVPDWPVYSATGHKKLPFENLSLPKWGDPEGGGKWEGELVAGPGTCLPARNLPKKGSESPDSTAFPIKSQPLRAPGPSQTPGGTPCPQSLTPMSPARLLAPVPDRVPASGPVSAGAQHS